jgi:hypothetical protein
MIRMVKARRIRWTGHIACIGGEELINILVGKPKGKRLERSRCGWRII